MKKHPRHPLTTNVVHTGRRYDGVHNPMEHVPSLPPAHPALGNLSGTAEPARNGTLAECLLLSGDDENIYLPGVRDFYVKAAGLRHFVKEVLGKTPEEFSRLGPSAQNDLTKRIRREFRHQLRRQGAHPRSVPDQKSIEHDLHMMRERGRVYDELRDGWARGPLDIQRPSGSSWHHLIEYDRLHTEGRFLMGTYEDVQPIVVEHDWARVVPPEGAWKLPFPACAWEFRISGVRCVAVTDVPDDSEDALLMVIYGHDGHWVCDDLMYEIGAGGELRVSRIQGPVPNDNPISLHRAVRVIYENIRAACITMDASVCRRETVAAPAALVKKRRAEGRAPPRDYSVVRLDRRRPSVQRVRTAGASTESGRTPQRGHWRRGTFVHFDDQDSGQEQYVNDGGFFVSRTWRSWHFAGDVNNLMPNREYRI